MIDTSTYKANKGFFTYRRWFIFLWSGLVAPLDVYTLCFMAADRVKEISLLLIVINTCIFTLTALYFILATLHDKDFLLPLLKTLRK